MSIRVFVIQAEGEGVESRRPLPEWDGYEVDGAGRIWSLKRGHEPRLVRTHVDPNGYLSVRLCRNGKPTRKAVHPLVARAFYGDKPAGAECRHLNGDKRDNRPENLTWGTKVQNAQDKIRHGTMATGNRNGTPRGADHPNAKLTPDSVREIRRLRAAGLGPVQLARRFSVSEGLCRRIVNGQAWSHVS